MIRRTPIAKTAGRARLLLIVIAVAGAPAAALPAVAAASTYDVYVCPGQAGANNAMAFSENTNHVSSSVVVQRRRVRSRRSGVVQQLGIRRAGGRVVVLRAGRHDDHRRVLVGDVLGVRWMDLELGDQHGRKRGPVRRVDRLLRESVR